MPRKETNPTIIDESIISARNSLIKSGKTFEKKINNSSEETDKKTILTEALATLVGTYEAAAEAIDSTQKENAFSKTVARCISAITEPRELQTIDEMKKLYLGTINLFDALTPESEEKRSESIKKATDLLSQFQSDEKEKGGARKEAMPPLSRGDRVKKMQGNNGIDGAAVEAVEEVVVANSTLVSVLQGLKISGLESVQKGEKKSAIEADTHAAAAEEEKGKATEAKGRAG